MRSPHPFAVVVCLLTRKSLGHLHQFHRLSEFLRPGEAALLDLQAAEVRAWPHLCPEALPQGVLQRLLLLPVHCPQRLFRPHPHFSQFRQCLQRGAQRVSDPSAVAAAAGEIQQADPGRPDALPGSGGVGGGAAGQRLKRAHLLPNLHPRPPPPLPP